MTLKKFFGVMLFTMMLLAGVILFKPATAAYADPPPVTTTTSSAVTYTITTNNQYVNKYTPARRICGYVKDSNGNPLANKTVYISCYGSRDDVPKGNNSISCNLTEVTTDSNGYYSIWGYNSGYYYVAFLSSEPNSVRGMAYVLIINGFDGWYY